VSALRHAPIVAESLACAINTPPQEFSHNPPNSEKVSANAVADRTLRSSVRRSELWRLPNALRCLPPPLRSCCAHIECNGITPYSVFIGGRAAVVTAALPWFHQRHRSRAARATLFVRCRSLFSSPQLTTLRWSKGRSLLASPNAHRPCAQRRAVKNL
jgi:hypothetical protein